MSVVSFDWLVDNVLKFHVTVYFSQIYLVELLVFAVLAKLIRKIFVYVVYKKRLFIFNRKQANKIDEDFIYNVEECPICLDQFSHPIRLQCGHVYCLDCITVYCQSNTNFNYQCALCRNQIVNLNYMKGYTNLNLSESDEKTLLKKLEYIVKYQNSTFFHIRRRILSFINVPSFITVISIILFLLIYIKVYFYFLDSFNENANYNLMD